MRILREGGCNPPIAPRYAYQDFLLAHQIQLPTNVWLEEHQVQQAAKAAVAQAPRKLLHTQGVGTQESFMHFSETLHGRTSDLQLLVTSSKARSY